MEILPDDYQRFVSILEKQSGILLESNKEYLISNRLEGLIREHNLSTFNQFVNAISLSGNHDLLVRVVEKMTTNETLWFRDVYPFEYLVKEMLPEILQKQSSANIWSAASSTGQEAYSMTMCIDEIGCLDKVNIYASDLSEAVIKKASSGLYQKIELNRGLSEVRLQKYFNQVSDTSWQIQKKLIDRVQFKKVNLLDINIGSELYDIVFCRNVLIYFSRENKNKVIEGLLKTLKVGGYLVLGASEIMTRNNFSVEMVKCNPGFAYKKIS
ncbi:MAG: protein-glutamate O-methyltransferase CheR [Gammaproteobacteria bacterium]|nr:protein-glutamate O-methyltransferase CheR [Gammaproteobacteria bacterium]MDH5629571.1 protein-glutamate O-methyltransferase CheR [Gammaproteobacteria bacterium]